MKKKVICFVYNTSQYLYNFRLRLMLEAASKGYHVIAIAPVDRYTQKILDNGIEYYPININSNSYNIFFDIYLFFRLYKLYRRLNPDILHHFTIKPVLYGSFAGRLANVPRIINSITGLGHTFIKSSLKRWILSLAYYSSQKSKNIRVIFQNPDDMNFFIMRKLIKPIQANLIISSGVDLKKFAPMVKEKKRKYDTCTFLFLSRLIYDKGIVEMVNAFERLFYNNYDVKLIIAGEIEFSHRRSISKKWLNGKSKLIAIDWIGYVDNVVELLSEVDVIVLPTYYREGVPHVLIEALAMGLPIITTNTPGCRIVVDDGANGFLVPPKDENTLYVAMKKLSSDFTLREKYGKRSLQKSIKFNVEKINMDTVELYK